MCLNVLYVHHVGTYLDLSTSKNKCLHLYLSTFCEVLEPMSDEYHKDFNHGKLIH